MKKILDTYRGLPKEVYVLFIVQIINRFGDFVMPFLTLYLTQRIGLPIGVTGLIITINSLLSVPGSLFGGKFADEIGRKKTYVFAQATAALFLVPCAFLNNKTIIVVLILISTFLNGAVRPSIQAIITDVVPMSRRKDGFSLNYLGINIGVALGPIAAGFLYNNYLALLFIGDALTSLIAVGLVVKNISETKPSEGKIVLNVSEKDEKGNLFEVLAKKPEIAIFLLIFMIYISVYSQGNFTLPLTMKKLFLSNGPILYGYLISVNAITVVLLNMFITRLTRKINCLLNIVIAGLLYAIGFGMIGYVKSFYMLAISTIIWTIGEILISVNFGTFLANNSPQNYRARFGALGNISWSLGAAIGTWGVGEYISFAGLDSVWNITIILGMLAAGLTFLLYLYNTNSSKLAEETSN